MVVARHMGSPTRLAPLVGNKTSCCQQVEPILLASPCASPPPFGLHAICRSIASFGQCEEVVGAERGPTRPGDPPRIGSFACRRAGFSVDRTFDAWTQYCGADLNYMRVCTDYRGGESGG